MKRALLFAVIFLTAGLLSAQTPLSIGGNIGLNVPIGSFNDVYKSGVSGEVAVFYLRLRRSGFYITIGYNAYTYKNDFFLQQVSTNFRLHVGLQCRLEGVGYSRYAGSQVSSAHAGFESLRFRRNRRAYDEVFRQV